MSRRLGIAAVTLVVALGGLAGVVTPAGAADPHTVTVTPSTGLSDGQTVTVQGAGFTETPALYDWSVTQCSASVLEAPTDLNHAVNDCNQAMPFLFTHADPAGNLSTPLVVHTTFTAGVGAGAHAVTCGQAPNDCAVLVAQFSTAGVLVGAATPISFGTPVPTLADCIRTFLGDHQHRPLVKLHRLLVCIFTALAHEPR